MDNRLKFLYYDMTELWGHVWKVDVYKRQVMILAIESSCDETAASVVKNGREVLSNVISSQDVYKRQVY